MPFMSAANANASSPAFRCGLPGECYFSPEIFVRARKRIFASAWTFAAHESRLQNPGDFAAVPAGGGIFALRGEDRQLRAFLGHAPPGGELFMMLTAHGPRRRR